MENFKAIVNGLKSSSSSCVQESLQKIRSKLITNDKGIKYFRECGGLDYLLPHLRKPNERILDVSLSILGNCCLEEESCLLVGKLNSFAPLLTILKTVNRDSIVGRACRVLGNLAQRNSNAEGLHSHGAVSVLVSLIENRDRNTSYPTMTMAVRAIRQLWMITEKREEMLSLNAVRSIAILLTAECESAGMLKSTTAKEPESLKKSQEELITGTLKCLGYFTTHATMQCAEQIQGDGRGFQCLVLLMKTHETLALKCLMNLCYLSPCRPILGTAGLVECLVSLLQKNTDVSWWPEGATRALAQLSGEAVNRSKLRHCGGLPLLVTAAKVSSHAFHALLQYVFDDDAFQILVNGGLISLLTDELVAHVTTMDFEHSYIENEETNRANNELDRENRNSEGKPKSKVTISQANKVGFTDKNDTLNMSKNDDELKVVIERDNMIVGFVDAIDSSDDSRSDDENQPYKRLKRSRSKSPKLLKKKKPQLIRMASKDWSAGVYWEPKSPEVPFGPQMQGYCLACPSEHSPVSQSSIGNQSGFSPEYSSSSYKRPRWDWSPESGVSAGEGSSSSPYWTEYQWSPSSSGCPTSPLSAHEESCDSEISGRYSPVCSEGDGDGAGESDIAGADRANAVVELDAEQVVQDLDELIMDDDEEADEVNSITDTSNIDANSKSSRIACVLVLLFRMSHGASSSYINRDEPSLSQTLELLTGRECLNALLDYVERCKRPLGRAARILAKVISNALCMMSILRHRIILRIYNMSVCSKHPPSKCQQCKQIMRLSTKLLSQFTILAESSYGIGEITYQLLKGSSHMQQTLSVTLPYIVRTERYLKKYFIECNALSILFTVIAECREDINHCVTALSKLAANTQIKDPKSLENRFKEQVYIPYDPILDDLAEDDIVIFELDDSALVRANKTFLCQNSEVFNAMLMGCFKESIEKRVRIKNVTKEGLEYLFTLLNFGLNNPQSGIQVFPMAEKLETNLEVFLLADRFLFDKLKILLNSAILQFQMHPNTADKIYVWSLNEGMGFLCVESVAYVLTGIMNDEERTRAFTSILSLQYREQWLDDIKTMILRQLMK